MTPAIYRTTVTYSRQARAQKSSEYRSYSWYVDVDALPRLPWWLRPLGRFNAETLRARLDACLTEHGAPVCRGRITALVPARPVRRAFDPVSVFWCHDRGGAMSHVIVGLHSDDGRRHACVAPPADSPVLVGREFHASPRNPVDGHYLVLAPRPGVEVDIMVSLHREQKPAFIATLRGRRHAATTRRIARLLLSLRRVAIVRT